MTKSLLTYKRKCETIAYDNSGDNWTTGFAGIPAK